MLKSLRSSAVFGLLGIALLACTTGIAATNSGAPSDPVVTAEITSPTSGLTITATIAAVTLGDECAASGGTSAAPGSSTCTSPPVEDAGAADASAKSPPSNIGGCGTPTPSYCQQSNVQIAFTASAGSSRAKVEIVLVELLDGTTGKLVDTLTSSKPQQWTGSSYASWDQTLAPAADLKASYDLSAPKWSSLSSSTGDSSRGSFSTPYKLHVTLRVDGVEVVLESTTLSREPPVAT